MKEYDVEYDVEYASTYYVSYHKKYKRTIRTIERVFNTEEKAIEFYKSLSKDIVPSLTKHSCAITIKDKDGKDITRSYWVK